MGLTQDQVDELWRGRIAAETRSLYFGDLASKYSRRKQIVTFSSFFLSSGAAAAAFSHAPSWLPVLLATIVAVMNAYAVAVTLDSRIRTMSKLHYGWNQISSEYFRLWNHTYADGADDEFYELAAREQELSELATTDAPYDEKLMLRWQQQVFRQHHLPLA